MSDKDWMEDAEEALFAPIPLDQPSAIPLHQQQYQQQQINHTRNWNQSHYNASSSVTCFDPLSMNPSENQYQYEYQYQPPHDKSFAYYQDDMNGHAQYDSNDQFDSSSSLIPPSSYLPHYSLSAVRSLPMVRSTNPRYSHPMQFQPDSSMQQQQHTYQQHNQQQDLAYGDPYAFQSNSTATTDLYGVPAFNQQAMGARPAWASESNFSTRARNNGSSNRRGGRGRAVGNPATVVNRNSSSYRHPSEWRGRGGVGGSWRGRGRGKGRGGGEDSTKYVSVYSEEPSVASFATMLKSNADEEIEDEEHVMYDDLNCVPPELARAPSSSAAGMESLPTDRSMGARASNLADMPGGNRSIASLPASIRRFFPYSELNRVQTHTFEPLYYGNENIIVSAPTGSGKTVCFEVAILAFFNEIVQNLAVETADDITRMDESLIEEPSTDSPVAPNHDIELPTRKAIPSKRSGFQWRKAVYIAPLKYVFEVAQLHYAA